MLLLLAVLAAQQPYVPLAGEWATRSPAQAGMEQLWVDSAVRFASAREINWSRNMGEQLARNTVNEPYPEIQGPFIDRGGPSGLIIRGGYIVAEWGDTRRVEMTFSVAKSYLSVVAGLAFDDGLLPDVNARVGATVTDGGFSSPHNAQITWHHLFTQSSEWEGTLWDKPDVADRRRGRDRVLSAPGTFYEYNDVRVNRTSLSLLRIWRRPLPEVLKQRIMDPIGASNTWVWHGYRNSFVEIEGRRIQSVSGGGHWGGGVWASTRDHARLGLLMLRRGRWANRQLLSERWITMAETPSANQPNYGYMWWLNTSNRLYNSAPASSVFARGAGGNIIWIDRENDLVVVVRWLDNAATNDFISLVVAAIRS